jgi:hypothetical protein
MRDSIDEQPEQKKFVFAYSLLLPGGPIGWAKRSVLGRQPGLDPDASEVGDAFAPPGQNRLLDGSSARSAHMLIDARQPEMRRA